jgi:hypothetical protein
MTAADFLSGASAEEPAREPDPEVAVQTEDPAEIAPITVTRFTPSDITATLQHVPALAREPDILARFADELRAIGVAGERQAALLLYLAITSRLLPRIVSVAVKGPSAGGKSFLVKQVLNHFPPSAYYLLSGMSEHALVYDETSLVHRMIVIYEAAGMAGDLQTYLMRSLLSEDHIRYVTVEKTKEGIRPKVIDRPGPTGLITTTTAVRLHPENETRLLSITVNDSPAQTHAVLLAYADGRDASGDVEPWHELQEWLAGGPTDVRVPYARTLAEAIPPVAVRLRRDFPTVLSLIRAHALLHRATREIDNGVLVATIADYAAVRELVADIVSDAVGMTVTEAVREAVGAVGDLTLAGGETSVTKLAARIRIDKASASRRVRTAIESGYLQNLEDRRGRPSRLTLGDPLPEEVTILPLAEEVLQCCSDVGGGTGPGVDESDLAPSTPRAPEQAGPTAAAGVLDPRAEDEDDQVVAPPASGWDPANPICTAMRADGAVCGKRMIAVPGGRRPFVCTSPAHNPEPVVQALSIDWPKP